MTFDTGALIALERRRQRICDILAYASANDVVITVPAAVIGEWWRGRTDVRERVLRCIDVEPLTQALAQIAGEALGSVRGATLVDAIVMASAASRGDVVFSSDVGDLERLRRHFPSVRVLGV